MLRFLISALIVSAASFGSIMQASAWGCLAVTPWVNGDRSIGWGLDAKNQRSQAAVAKVAMQGCESQRRKMNPHYPSCFLAGCSRDARTAAETMAISPR